MVLINRQVLRFGICVCVLGGAGYAAQGNEFCYGMLLAASFMLNRPNRQVRDKPFNAGKCPFLDGKRSFCPDRLGTNIRKTHTEMRLPAG